MGRRRNVHDKEKYIGFEGRERGVVTERLKESIPEHGGHGTE